MRRLLLLDVLELVELLSESLLVMEDSSCGTLVGNVGGWITFMEEHLADATASVSGDVLGPRR
jgi:hypothetical protein